MRPENPPGDAVSPPRVDRSHDEAKRQDGDAPGPATAPPGAIVSPDTQRDMRIPPGQSRTRKWPVLDAHGPPRMSYGAWRLKLGGLVEREVDLDLAGLAELPHVQVFADMHCVTRWSRLGNLWEGVSTRALAELAGIHRAATHVLVTGSDHGWTTNLPLEHFLAEDCLLADQHDGLPLALDHGGPVRLIIPRLYAWKSAKWVRRIEFLSADRPGFWEAGGYHMRGDPWLEERFGDGV